MDRLTREELADMHLVYGAANGGSRRAARMYAERFPARQHPDYRLFAKVHQNLRESGNLRVSFVVVVVVVVVSSAAMPFKPEFS